MLAVPTEFPVRERLRLPGWIVAVRSEVGPVRRQLEDAWRIVPEATWQGNPALVVGVFDGLGGEPNGQEAAWTAAEHLPRVVGSARDPGSVLALLNGWVRGTGGFTTAVVALAPRVGPVVCVTAGDSAAYVRDGERARLVVPKHVGPGGEVARYLGGPDVDAAVGTIAPRPGQALLLCTDGVDEVVGETAIARAMAGPDASAALEELFTTVHEEGCPDNATAILVRRTA